jgi:hypothetical protein
VEDHLPKGYKIVHQSVAKDGSYGTKTTYMYFKNKSGNYICCVVGAGEDPYMINIGNPLKRTSKFQKILSALPRKFNAEELKKSAIGVFGNNLIDGNALGETLVTAGLIATYHNSKRSKIYSKTNKAML